MFTSKIMPWLLLLNAVEAKKRGIRAIDGFRKKLIMPDSKIPECPDFEVKSKIWKLFMNEKFLEENSVRLMKLILFFVSIAKKK